MISWNQCIPFKQWRAWSLKQWLEWGFWARYQTNPNIYIYSYIYTKRDRLITRPCHIFLGNYVHSRAPTRSKPWFQVLELWCFLPPSLKRWMTASQARPYLWLKMEGITSLKRLKLSLFEMFFVLNDCDVRCVGIPMDPRPGIMSTSPIEQPRRGVPWRLGWDVPWTGRVPYGVWRIRGHVYSKSPRYGQIMAKDPYFPWWNPGLPSSCPAEL